MEENSLRCEIGSEFEIECPPSRISKTDGYSPRILNPLGKEGVLLLSGRTAIDCICRDLQSSCRERRVYMPAYCCSSMIVPFIRNGFSIEFYDVGFDGEEITYRLTDEKIDVLYLNNYFGFKTFLDIEWIRQKQKEGSIIIYDRTHSLFLKNDPYIDVADYIFCSLRKWFAVASGAILYKKNGNLIDFNLRECSYVQAKFNAQILKAQYLTGDESVRKEIFYSVFAEFSHQLEKDYADYKMDDKSILLLKSMDFMELMDRRRRNAELLYTELRDVGWLKFLFRSMGDGVVPLFVPVIIETPELRDKLRNMLITRQIYCPIHWPKDTMIAPHMEVNRIYDREISLICDQRYTPNQISGIVQTIKELK